MNHADGFRPLGFIRPHPALLLSLALACNSAGAPRSNPSEDGGSGGGEATGGKTTSTGGKSGTATGGKTGGEATGGASATGGAGGTGGAMTPPQGGSGGGADAGPQPDGPPPNSAGCAGKFCDDFEGFAPGSMPGGMWTIHLEKGTLAVDQTRAFSGTRSVKLSHPGAPAAMFMELRQPVLPLAGNVTYGRLMYYITKNPTTGGYPHFEIVRGTGPLAGGAQAQLNMGAESGKVMINYEPGDCSLKSKVAFPEKKWTCFQFRFDLPKGDMHEWVDNISADDIAMKPGCAKMPTAVDVLHVGWESYHGEGAEIWIDDVVVSDQPIPCPTGAPSKP